MADARAADLSVPCRADRATPRSGDIPHAGSGDAGWGIAEIGWPSTKVPGRRLYRRRKRIEPFHEWFKEDFELTQRVWHRGLPNNQTQLLTAVFTYQLLVRYNCQHGRMNGQVQWILDCL